ncbi:MAG: DUF4838 domain-containing protein [Clostridia bacterium]|nr:DUF4838 domain-containing protein [Clostridia bacterium]
MKRLLSILLTVCMFLSILSACNTVPANDETDTAETEAEEPGVQIAVNGTSEYVIVRGENASPSEVTASTELQAYLKQIIGAELPIVTDTTAAVDKEIIVGKTNREAEGAFDREELGDDGFVIKTDETRLWIVGGEQRGTLYGVYEFLESYLGCRFYAADFEKVPAAENITLEIAEDKQTPVIESRFSYWTDSFNRSYAVKRKLNLTWRENMPEELGGCVYFTGPRKAHTLRHLAEQADILGTYEQPCVTSEEVYNTVLKNVLEILRADPDPKLISVSQEDGNEDGVCKCDSCMAAFEKYGAWSGVYLDLVNRIARDIRDEFPDVIIHTLAYQFSVEPPTGIVPEDNVMIQLCVPMTGCYRHTLEEFAQCMGDRYDQNEDFCYLLNAWSELADYIGIWDYTTNYFHYNIPFPNFETLRANIRYYVDHNVKYAFIQGNCNESGEFDELRCYLINKLLWDPYMTEEEYQALIDEFLTDYYGPGGAKIREYINILQEETADSHFNCTEEPKQMFSFGSKADTVKLNEDKAYPDELTADMILSYESIDWTPYWNYFTTLNAPKTLTEGRRLFAEALDMAENDEQRSRIEESSIQLDYLESYYMHRLIEAGDNDIYDMFMKFCDDNPDLIDQSDKYKIYKAIKKQTKEQLLDRFEEFNKALGQKMIDHGITYIHDWGEISDFEGSNFREVAYYWNWIE